MKKQLEESIILRQKAIKDCSTERYHFGGPPHSFDESNLLEMVPNGRFVDKSKIYRKCVETDHEESLGLQLATFPRRFGKTTWLSFLELSLGSILTVDRKSKEQFYNAVATLQEGKFFLQAPIRPVINVDMLSMDTDEGMVETVKSYFKAHGIKSTPMVDFASYLHDALLTLQRLYSNAIAELDEEKPLLDVKSHVHPNVLVLIDEYDHPYRKLELSNNQFKDKCEGVIRLAETLCQSLKDKLKKAVWGVCIVSLVPLGQTGLSLLQCKQPLTFSKKYHQLFGISQEELLNSLEAHSTEDMSLQKVLAWASHKDVGIVKNSATPRYQKECLLFWRRSRINGFCMALDRTVGDTLDPLYSPLDVIRILQSVQESEFTIPPLQWIAQSRSLYGTLLANRVDTAALREAMLGTFVPRCWFDQRQVMSEYFGRGVQAHCALLFFLGLVQVQDCDKDTVTLSPTDDSRSLKDKVSIIRYHFPGEHSLSNSQVDEYFKNKQTFIEKILSRAKAGADRIGMNYGGHNNLQEIPFQDAVYHCLDEFFRHPLIETDVETLIQNGRKRIDIRCTLKAETGKPGCTVIIEIKIQTNERLQTKLSEALQQARDYRRRLSLNSSNCHLVGIVLNWKKGTMYTVNGESPRKVQGKLNYSAYKILSESTSSES